MDSNTLIQFQPHFSFENGFFYADPIGGNSDGVKANQAHGINYGVRGIFGAYNRDNFSYFIDYSRNNYWTGSLGTSLGLHEGKALDSFMSKKGFSVVAGASFNSGLAPKVKGELDFNIGLGVTASDYKIQTLEKTEVAPYEPQRDQYRPFSDFEDGQQHAAYSGPVIRTGSAFTFQIPDSKIIIGANAYIEYGKEKFVGTFDTTIDDIRHLSYGLGLTTRLNLK